MHIDVIGVKGEIERVPIEGVSAGPVSVLVDFELELEALSAKSSALCAAICTRSCDQGACPATSKPVPSQLLSLSTSFEQLYAVRPPLKDIFTVDYV